MQDLWLLCMTRRLNVLNKCMKFGWNTSNNYKVIERTQNRIANDQREITRKYPKQSYGFCAWHIVSLSSRSVWSFNQTALTVFNLQSGQKIAFSYVTRRNNLKFVCCFTSQVNSYGQGETASSPNHIFSWASLNKWLTSTSCTYFACNWQQPFLNDSAEGRRMTIEITSCPFNLLGKYNFMHLAKCLSKCIKLYLFPAKKNICAYLLPETHLFIYLALPSVFLWQYRLSILLSKSYPWLLKREA